MVRPYVVRLVRQTESWLRVARTPLLRYQFERVRRLNNWRAGDVRLNLGCGTVHLRDWCNVDLRRGGAADLGWDLRNGLPLPAGSVSRVYSEHFFEHLELEEGQRLFADCRRALRNDGVFRIAMPDLAKVVENYRGGWRDVEVLKKPEFGFLDTNARYINLAFRAWEHRYLYDFADLELRLRAAGFSTIVRCEKGQSEHEDLRGLETRDESWLVVEASP